MRAVTLGALALLLPACVVELDTESASVGELHDCVVPLPPLTSTSAPIDAGDRWIFESVNAADGNEVRGAVAEISSDPCDGIDFVRHPSGAVRSILVLSTAESFANDTRTDGRRLGLAPRAAVN